MKKIVFSTLTLLLAVATLTVQAQQEPGKIGERSRGNHQEEGFHNLKLSEDQKAKFKSLNEDFRQQMQALRKKDDITVKEWRTKMETLRKDHHEKIQGLLTNEQKTQLQKMKDDRKAIRQTDRDARAKKMKIRLGLTDEQEAHMKQNHTELEGKMKALRENKSLSDDQRREQFRQLKDKQRENLKSILSQEQWKKLHEKQGHHRHHRELV